jgi:hypothetical protein
MPQGNLSKKTKEKQMKRVFIAAFLLLTMNSLQAQISPRVFGLRLSGNGSVSGAEISMQQELGMRSRMELDAGYRGNENVKRIYTTGMYHWYRNIHGGLYWFAGPGGSIGMYNDYKKGYYFNVALGTQIGVEYNLSELSVPLLLSFDVRGLYDFMGDDPGMGWGYALGIRYTLDW